MIIEQDCYYKQLNWLILFSSRISAHASELSRHPSLSKIISPVPRVVVKIPRGREIALRIM